MVELPSLIKKNPYAVIGGIEFKTQSSLLDYAKSLLNSYSIGDYVTQPHRHFLINFLSRHEWASDKIGPGVLEFQLRENCGPNWSARGFWIIRVDGTEADFSIYNCLKNESSDPKRLKAKYIKQACRTAISAVIDKYSRDRFSVSDVISCDQTGVPITISQAHVDHYGEWPFARIVDEWIDGVIVEMIDVEGHGDGQTFRYFSNQDIADDFVKFHNERAVLRIVHKQVNMKDGSRGYETRFMEAPL
jgi:hypothetical protein